MSLYSFFSKGNKENEAEKETMEAENKAQDARKISYTTPGQIKSINNIDVFLISLLFLSLPPRTMESE